MSRTSVVRHSTPPVIEDKDDALMRELRKHHPEIFGNPETTQPRRRAAQRPASPLASGIEADEVSAPPGTVPTGTLADFVAGAFALTLMPAAACSPAEREMFFGELLPLREALMHEFGVTAPSEAMLVDTAIAALFESRRLSAKASCIMGAGTAAEIRAAETVDRMVGRAHTRFMSAIELLRRPRGTAVRIDVEAIEHVHVGDNVVAVAGPKNKDVT